jgi:septal ring factor EnvC (AmiA/AmiB activator)
MNQEKLDAAFDEMEFDDALAVNVVKYQLETNHLKQEIAELNRLLYEYEIQLRKRNEQLARIYAAMQ